MPAQPDCKIHACSRRYHHELDACQLRVTALVSGINNIDQLRENAAIVDAFSPMSPAVLSTLESRCLPATEANIYHPEREWLA